MSLLARLLGKEKKAPASIARERLRVIIAQSGSKAPDYLPQLRHEIMEVIARYVKVSSDNVNVCVTREGHEAVLELNVALPDHA
jgi:cell division topological specificity factor